MAEELRHERQVAIKVLEPELAAVVGGDRFHTDRLPTTTIGTG